MKKHPSSASVGGLAETIGSSFGSLNHTHGLANHTHSLLNAVGSLPAHQHTAGNLAATFQHRHNIYHHHRYDHVHGVPGHAHNVAATPLGDRLRVNDSGGGNLVGLPTRIHGDGDSNSTKRIPGYHHGGVGTQGFAIPILSPFTSNNPDNFQFTQAGATMTTAIPNHYHGPEFMAGAIGRTPSASGVMGDDQFNTTGPFYSPNPGSLLGDYIYFMKGPYSSILYENSSSPISGYVASGPVEESESGGNNTNVVFNSNSVTGNPTTSATINITGTAGTVSGASDPSNPPMATAMWMIKK